MRQGRYLNIILTINALLLAMLAWTQLAGQAPLAQNVAAQGGGSTMTTAAEQRQRMIESLRGIHQSVNETNRRLDRGMFQVRVANLAELQRDQDGDDESAARSAHE